ncbi:MAG: hypothetical protein P1U89_19810 [Verrucomicrobiales bacterium]|nr:hypothetical protein [Verrucomicrobiales bacterium]
MESKIALNPNQKVELIPELAALVEKPPDHDVVIRSLSKKQVNDTPLIQGDLVIAGKDTLGNYPEAAQYPVHFRKTYYPTSFHPPATIEYEKHRKIAEILTVAPVIGAEPNSFRSCFLSGIPLDRLTPFGIEPLSRNLDIAEQTDPARLIGLWNLLVKLDDQLKRLHSRGFAHGDLFFHNIIITKSPIDLVMIDFALAIERSADQSDEEWLAKCRPDREELERHALWVQAGLGPQPDELGTVSIAHAEVTLSDDAGKCLDKIRDHSFL